MLGISGRMVGSESQWLGGFNPHKKSVLFNLLLHNGQTTKTTQWVSDSKRK